MRISVDHVTLYRYDRPVRSVVQSHRLTPSVCDGQKVISWEVTVSGGLPGGAFRDGSGDWVQGWSVQGPVQEITVRVKGLVETQDMAGVLRGLREFVPPEAWLCDTAATRADAALMAMAAKVKGSDDLLAAAHTLSGLVSEAIAYRPGTTTAHTTAAEAVAQGEGVCQDHAHALIAAARAAEIPARYVSGYLLASENADMHEAAHAWAELHIDGLGWVGFDPANSCCPDDRYIRLGVGLDAQDAAPIKGIARGAGGEKLEVTVAVGQTQQ